MWEKIRDKFRKNKIKRCLEIITAVFSILTLVLWVFLQLGCYYTLPYYNIIEIANNVSLILFYFILSLMLLKVIKEQIEKLDKIDGLKEKLENFDKSLTDFSKNISKRQDILKQAMDEFESSTLKQLGIANEVVAVLCEGKFIDKNIRDNKEYKDTVYEGMDTLRYNLQEWGQLISNPTNDDALTRVWLNYFKTYFREESFDIKRKELVTNGRNYPFLLTTTLLSFLKSIEGAANKKVVYYTVTPVHPKDWFNWPYGKKHPRAYFEANFMRLYRTALKEILKEYKDKDKLDHGRFLLVAQKDDVAKSFNWTLDLITTIQLIKLSDWHLIDCPVTCEDLNELPELKNVFAILLEKWGKTEELIVPMFCTNTSIYNGITDEKLKKAYKSLITKYEKSTYDNTIEPIITKKKNFYKEQLEANIRALYDNIKENKNAINILETIMETIAAINSQNSKITFSSFCENIQKLSMLYPEYHIAIQDILKYAMYLKNEDKTFNSLQTAYLELHSSTNNAYHILLQEKNAENWKENRIPSEFAVFGIQNNENAKPEWKIVLQTDISYPFETAKIQLLTNSETDPERKNRFNALCVIMDDFMREDNSDYFSSKENFS